MPPHVGNDDDAVGSANRHKKRNAALSCAECRRLKLRCDRKFPCSACVKRGCSAICPDGSLTTGKGNRFVLANTEALHDKITELSHRVRELEDALASEHAALSRDEHPLLREELRRIKNPLEREVVPEQPKQNDEDDAIDAVGSLSISHTGRTNFYGQTANSWYLLQNEEGETHEDDVETPDIALPGDVPWFAHAFPFSTPISTAVVQVRGQLINLLPNAAEAQRTADCYYSHAAWMYDPLPRHQFDETIFSRIYDAELVTDHDPFESHRLAVLYMILAIGTLVDLKIRSHDPLAVQYYQLGRAALSLDSVLEEPSVPAVQAMLLMSHFLFLADIDGPRWTIMGLVVKLAQSIGLHRDSARWNLDSEETQKRRSLLWETFVYDSWQSLTFGRPPSFSMAHIDSKMAFDTSTNSAGQIEMSYAAWKHRFSSECLSVVHDQVFGARPAPYPTILELDKKVRNYYVPPSLQVPGFGGTSSSYSETEAPSVQLSMQRHIILAIKEVTLLYMHRGFFARALEDHPDDPLGSKYGQSVLSAHRSASSFVALVSSLWSQHKALTERHWFLFTHVFSCAIVLGSIPTRCPTMGLARSALQNLDCAYELFTKVGETSRAAKVLPVLKKLRERAHAAMADAAQQTASGEVSIPQRRESGPIDPLVQRDEEEVANLSGKTRLVSPKASSSGPYSPSSSSSRGSKSPTAVSTSSEAYTPFTSPGVFSEPQLHPHINTINTMNQQQHHLPQHQLAHAQQDMSMYQMVAPPPQQWAHGQHHALPYMQIQMQVQQQQQQQQQHHDMTYPMQSQFQTYDYAMVNGMRPAGGVYGHPNLHVVTQSGSDATMSPPVEDPDAPWRNLFAEYSTV
ncbi:hypothetical protein BD410DRAFT_786992 [Rickenella mellea]|uniref:Zn(2)-C6 fungal-type domain-containing protein n=1 Tax=Rickenella mellea TaxID=50990 RepID=A0A4Y7Q7U2_9AGAM|nr:hypothetical protein BD410DRAFT_786992 [Rickenella mellea]